MRNTKGVAMLMAALIVGFVTSMADHAVAGVCEPSDDVLQSLQCLEGITAAEVTSTVAGYRQFELTIDQPTDHAAATGERFQQRLVLLHKGWGDPMVLQTSGYSIFGVRLSRLASTFGTNQIQVEHRYFSTSTPASGDWTKLDVRQSAADFHAVTRAFKQLYRSKWVGTGASKGGMTSVYHRRFYPQDLDGTVADVAPLSFSTDDQRYVTFVENTAGGATWADCRSKLETFQGLLLARRDNLIPAMTGTFSGLGSASVAFEHAVVEVPFAFWQYGNPADAEKGCAAVPGVDASDDTLRTFLETVNDPSSYGDEGFSTFQSYYWQAGTQLGGPGAKLSHLQRLHDYTLDQYMPRGVPYTYSNALMIDVEQWVRKVASGILFVYGEFDPWTAGAFPRSSGRDMHFYVAPGANHSAKFTALSAADRAAAVATLTRWMGRAPIVTETEAASDKTSLDDLELTARRLLRLP